MEAIKIVTNQKGENDALNYFSPGTQMLIRRGLINTNKQRGTVFITDGVEYPCDRLLFSGPLDDGSTCKMLIIFRDDGKMLHIVTDSTIYFLGSTGKTIETIH